MKSSWGESTQHFYQLSPDQILSAVEDKGHRVTGRALSLMSLENRVYEIEIEKEGEVVSPSERFVVAKFYRPGRWNQEQIQEEHDFLLELAGLEIPVIAPLVFHGQSLHYWPPGQMYYALFPKRGGRSLHELSEEQTLRLARTLGRIHSVGKIRNFKHRPALTADSYVMANLEYLCSSGFIPSSLLSSYRQVASDLYQLASRELAALPYQRIHGDCHHGNILWADASPLFLDFDDTLMGPTVQDFWPLAQIFDDPEKRGAFVEAYQTFHHFNPQHLRLVPLLRGMRIVHYSAWIGKRYEDPSFSKIFVHFKDELYWQKELQDLRTLTGEFINSSSLGQF